MKNNFCLLASVIDKLPNFGITGLPQQSFCCYLCDGINKYAINKQYPQQNPLSVVSCRDPSWDCCYFSCTLTMLQLPESCNIVKYADDTILFYSHKHIKQIVIILNNDFASLSKWLDCNELIINTKQGKTEVMIFGTSKRLNSETSPICIKNHFTTFNQAQSYKYLGLYLNSTLNMPEHV